MTKHDTIAGLVLEGGGMRGVFTSGVLRGFVDMQQEFSSVYGVSMGACNGVNWISRQYERNRMVNINYVNHPDYMNYLRMMRGRGLFGIDFLFREIPYNLVPLDFEAVQSNPARFWIGVTDCHTGEPVYYEKDQLAQMDDFLTAIQASMALPLVQLPVPFRDRTVMDGGIVDPIPLQKCFDEGEEKAVLVLTQQKGYRKKASKSVALCKKLYPDFTGMNDVLTRRHELYNDVIATVEQKERNGDIFVLRPESLEGVGRLSRNKGKLLSLYDAGYRTALRQADALREYLA